MGNLIIHYGPMFSGKTTALIKAYGNYTRQGIPVVCLKPQLDSRYSANEEVVSHKKKRIQARLVDHTKPIKALKGVNGEKVVLIDEIQFFDPTIVAGIEALVSRGIIVVVAGLDLDSNKQEFGSTLDLVEKALSGLGKAVQHFARCDGCQGKAEFSYVKQRKSGQVTVGGAEMYGACCGECYHRITTITQHNDQQK